MGQQNGLGHKGMGVRDEDKRGRELKRQVQERSWLKWLGYIGMRSWGREAHELEKFSVWDGLRRAGKSQDASMDSVTGPCNAKSLGASICACALVCNRLSCACM